MSRTAVNIVHGLLVAANLAAGAAQVIHHRYASCWTSFFAAGIILGMNIYFQKRERERERMKKKLDPHGLAYNNLKRAIKITGARWDGCEQAVTLHCGSKTKFSIHPGIIECEKQGKMEATCYYGHSYEVPRYEIMATALLLLKHNPKLFDMWKNDRGKPYA